MGGQEFCDRYQGQLEKELDEMWQSYQKHNEVVILLYTTVYFMSCYVLFIIYLLFFLFLFVLKVQKSLQCLPHPSCVVRPGVHPLHFIRNLSLRRPIYLCLIVWLHPRPGVDSNAYVGFHSLLGPVPLCRRSYWPSSWSCSGTGNRIGLYVFIHYLFLCIYLWGEKIIMNEWMFDVFYTGPHFVCSF